MLVVNGTRHTHLTVEVVEFDDQTRPNLQERSYLIDIINVEDLWLLRNKTKNLIISICRAQVLKK